MRKKRHETMGVRSRRSCAFKVKKNMVGKMEGKRANAAVSVKHRLAKTTM
jgi:hypothetical protein